MAVRGLLRLVLGAALPKVSWEAVGNRAQNSKRGVKLSLKELGSLL